MSCRHGLLWCAIFGGLLVGAWRGVAWSAEEADDEPAKGVTQEEIDRTYFARDGLSPEELSDWLERMQSKPDSIRARPGFVAAILDATQRILDVDSPQPVRNAAVLTRFEVLHFAAINGDAKSDEALFGLADKEQGNTNATIARLAKLHLLEQKAGEIGQPEQVALPPLLEELKAFLAAEPVTERELRLASRTVKVANMLEDLEARNKFFDELGALLSKSSDRKMARYGKQVAKVSKQSDLVGQTLEIEGVAVDGTPFDWNRYRGKVTLVVFWATWCGPCRAEMPNTQRAYEKFKDRGFDVVGISLDQDREALETFLGENPLPWAILFHEGGDNPMAEKYGVQGIPTQFLVDADGKVISDSVRGPALDAALEKLLPMK
ncbi:MAG: TlpA family protein disulfide reductase [Pirellulales bacterium]